MLPLLLIAALVLAFVARRFMPWRLRRSHTLLLINLGTVAMVGGGALFVLAAGACFDCDAASIGFLVSLAGFATLCLATVFGAPRTRNHEP